MSLFCFALLCVHSSIAIVWKRKLVALLLLSYRCIETINVMWLFLTVPWVGLQYVIVLFLFCCFTYQVNSYGHGGTVSSPNNIFFLDKLEQAVNQ